MNVTWPNGYSDLRYSIKVHNKKITGGLLIALDPSSGGSSQPGFAIFRNGELVTSGEMDIPNRKPIYERLQILYDRVTKLTPDAPDVFVIEQIRGQNFSHDYLRWSVGVTIAAARTPVVLEAPTNFWKALAKVTPGYVKGNAMDAEMIGGSIILFAKENP